MLGEKDVNCVTKFQLKKNKSFIPAKNGIFLVVSLQIHNQSVWLVFTASLIISNLEFVETMILKF